MALPNPFVGGTLPKPSFTPVSPPKKTSLNPGPGLPHAPQPQYSSECVRRMHQTDTKQKPSDFQRNTFQSGQYQPFSCDRCDRSFKSQELLDVHIAEHIPCGINGCPFVAHPKIVEKHIEMQHETGLAEQIMRLNTPEEIQKWRDERKNRFPSTANVARRQAEQKERLERGEVLYEPKKRFARDRKEQGKRERDKGWDARRNQNRKNNRDTDERRNTVPQQQLQSELSQSVPVANQTKLSDSGATVESSIVNSKEQLSDGELKSDSEEKSNHRIPVSSTALANLINYASDSEDNGAVAKKSKLSTKGVEKPAVNCTKEYVAKPTKRRKKGKSQKNAVLVPATKELVRPKRLTLLQKLLQGEILHERNVILQCVHHIVQQNFFGLEQGKVSVVASEADTAISKTDELCT